jgi:hypothetical protein
MKLRVMAGLAVALFLSGPVVAKEKEPAPCKVYFTVVENDEVTVHLAIPALNKPQSSWYEKYGDREEFAGICYVAKASDAPADAPGYAIVWGEHLASKPYTYSYQTQGRLTGT